MERERIWRVADYDLEATLESGQAFGWDRVGAGWEGVVGRRWVRLEDCAGGIRATVAVGVEDWGWLERYLGVGEDLGEVLATFPDDGPLREAVAASRGLRLLRQDAWEALACFICSSTKQIVQIRQIVRLLRERHGERVEAGGGGWAWAFPGAGRLALLEERELRECKLGFRAPYLLGAARAVAGGALDLEAVRGMRLEEARAALMGLRGVGRKVADCALLFGLGFDRAFPVDVWVRAALARMYFPRARKLTARRLERFSEEYFGPRGGYAQQYLFHHVRTKLGRAWVRGGRGENGTVKRRAS